MIDARKTGAFISRLRKANDWTQLDLAEKLHVTHQAVSRWETGDTYPDITILPRIAQLFGVSVDDLLNGGPTRPQSTHPHATRGEVLVHLGEGQAEKVARMVRDDEANLESLIEVAPAARPSVINRVVEHLEGYRFTPDQVTGLAPFVGSELLDALVMDMNFTELDGDSLASLAPFVDEETMERMIASMPEGPLEAAWVSALAPFLSEATLGRLVERIRPETVNADSVSNLAPFVGDHVLERLVELVPPEELDMDAIENLAPFLRVNILEALITRSDDPASAGHLTALAPFLGQAGLRILIQRARADALTPDTIVSLAPFLEKDLLSEILRRGMRRD